MLVSVPSTLVPSKIIITPSHSILLETLAQMIKIATKAIEPLINVRAPRDYFRRVVVTLFPRFSFIAHSNEILCKESIPPAYVLPLWRSLCL